MLEAVLGILMLAFNMDAACHETEAESERSVEILIPEASASHVIGDKGTRYGNIMDETRCKLHAYRQGGIVEQKRVRITGWKIHDITFAVSRVHTILVDLAYSGVLQSKHFDIREGALTQDMHGFQEHGNVIGCNISLLMSKDEASWLTGRHGNKTDQLQISVRNAETPPFHPNDVIVEIIGASLSEQIHTLELMIEDLLIRDRTTNRYRLFVPFEHFGAIIGHGGKVIKRITEETGANLHQHPAERHGSSLYPLRVVEVMGRPHECISAARAIYEIVEIEQLRVSKVDGEPNSALAPKQSSQLMQNKASTEHRIQRVQPAPAICKEATVPSVRVSEIPCVISREATVPSVRVSECPCATIITPDAQEHVTTATIATPGAMTTADTKKAPPCLGNDLALFLILPTTEIARFLASGDLGIARRTGAQLTAGSGGAGEPMLRVYGTPLANASACYLVQEALWLTGAYRVAASRFGVDTMGVRPTL